MTEAIALEVDRQIDLIESGGSVRQETRLYDGDKKVARSMRSKEEANDYRYFPCPDLLPVIIDDTFIESVRAQMPELPEARKARFENEYQLSDYDADMLAGDLATSQYFETLTKNTGDAKQSANWIMGELSARLNSEEKTIAHSPVSAEQLAGVIKRTKDGTISNKIAKQVFEALWLAQGDSADAVIEAKGLKQVSDTGALEKMVDDVIANSSKQVDNYKNADPDKRPKMLGYFVGQIMKASKGQANPQAVNEILLKKLDELI